MKIKQLCTALVLALAGAATFAATALPEDEIAPRPISKTAKMKAAKKVKKVDMSKLVDINSASATELKKLTGIGDAEAAKIIAGRPYATKAWLVGKNILPEEKFVAIRSQIIAKQPFKDAAKNAALYQKK